MAVKFSDVSYKNIFKNLNLEINNSQIVSIVGKNGSGKTSFLNLIYGLDLDFLGKIVIGRKKIINQTKIKELQPIRTKTFFLTQEYQNQLFNIDVLKDIKYGISNFNFNKLEELLKCFNLNKDILNKNYSELSLGQMKKILLITMFIKDNKIILLDDPTSNLDQKSISSLIKLLKKEKRNGKIIIIASQDVEFLFAVSDVMLMIENENIIEINNKYDFFDNEQLMGKCNLLPPNVLKFRQTLLKRKNIKLIYRDNINDLIKDIYRYAK